MVEGLKPYAELKESGVPWLGAVPAGWEVRRSKQYLREVDERSVHGDEELLSVSHKTGVTPRREKNITMFLAESNVGHKVCRADDIVVNTMWAWMAALGVARQTGIVSPSYGVYRPRNPGRFMSRYLDELLRTPAYTAEYVVRSTGITASRLRLYPDQFLQIPMLAPPIEEQHLIVRFLDHADRRIRRLIAAKQRMIKLLEEQKRAVVLDGVRRGVDGAVQVKPSGSRFLGSVPAHWLVKPMWSVTRLRAETNPGGLGLLSVFLDRGVILYGDGGGQVHAPSLDLSGYQVVHRDDFVLNNQQAWRGSVGLSPHHGIISPAYIVLALSSELTPEYSALLLRSRGMIDEFVAASKGVGDIQRQLFWPFFRLIRVPLPPIDEQRRIAAHCMAITTELNASVAAAAAAVALLREYRTRLIADVVTGKLDVRAAAAALPDEAVPAEPTEESPADDAEDTPDDAPEDAEP